MAKNKNDFELLHRQHSSFSAVKIDVPILPHANWKIQMSIQIRYFKLHPIVEDEWSNAVTTSSQFLDMDSTAIDQIKLNVESF